MRNYGRRIHHINTSDGWKAMDSAPRDGSTVEIMCTYGVAPHYGIAQWSDQVDFGEHGVMTCDFAWRKVGQSTSSFSDEGSLYWRPFNGAAATYVDPTGGFQDDPLYWRQAAAVSMNLPPMYFEKPEKHEVNGIVKQGVLQRLHAWLTA